ncbi:MAG TPA: hypothetical protein PKD48_01835 [Sphingopyxis sp.]|nr:hypothetical protein [Sphingopyxis sp.]
MAEITVNDQIVSYTRNGFVIFPADRKTSKVAYLGRNGTDLTNAMGVVLLSLTTEQVAALRGEESADREHARKAETTSAYATRGHGSVSSTEYDNLRGTLGDDLAAQMARQMQG